MVKDASGAVVGNAAITIVNDTTGNVERTITTSGFGLFAASLLPPGDYTVVVKATGFKTFNAKVSVRLNETTRVDANLTVGAVSEEVSVEAVSTLVNTESATTGQPVDARTLNALPLAVPNFTFLLTLSPGTMGEPANVGAAGRGTVDINVNGQRTTNNSVQLDGINVNDFNLAHFDTIPLPNPNAIQEFKVATSLYDASLGSKGGGALNLVLRTGTKELHWSAYWQHRNDVLNANEWFFNHNGTPRGRLLQNVLGFSGSGPVWGLGGFWFANVHGLRARNGVDPRTSTTRPIVPVFPSNPDGTTSAALLARQFGVPVSNIDPVAVNLLNLKNNYYGGAFLVPRPGQAGCGAIKASSSPATLPATMNCTFSKVTPIDDTQYTITYDRPVRSSRDKFTARWFYDNEGFQAPFGSGGTLAQPGNVSQKNRFASLSYQTQISNQQMNEFRFGFNRFLSTFAPRDLVKLSDIGATRPNQAELPGMYFLTVTGLFSVGTDVNDDRGTIQNSFTWADTWLLAVGKHVFRAGGEVNRFQLNRYNRFATRGSITTGPTTSPQFSSFQSFIQGRATSLQSAAGDPQRYFRNTDYALFFEDDWRIHPRLTLNLGLRWEPLGFASELKNRLSNYDANRALAGLNPFVFAEDVNLGGFTGTPDTAKTGNCLLSHCRDLKNFAPRIGFAWDLFGNHKTVIRGGYGIYYQRVSNQTTLQTNLGPPFNVQSIDARPSGAPGLSLANPFPGTPPTSLIAANVIPQKSRFAGFSCLAPPKGSTLPPCTLANAANHPLGQPIFVNDAGQKCSGFGGTAQNCAINLASFTAPPLDFHSPYTQQWNLTVQQKLGEGWALELGYVGSHYLHGIGIFNPFVRTASPTNPIVVKDINGVTYTITTNTVNNEPLRNQLLLSRKNGTRFAGNVGFAGYNSLQATLSHRFQKGLFFQGAYTWSKLIDNVSGSQSTDELNITRSGQGGANFFNLGTFNPALARALGDFDRRHRAVFSFDYELPVPKQGIWGSQAFQGWATSGIVYFQKGLPFSVTDPSGGGAFGSAGISTPLLACASLANAPTSGDIQSRVDAYLRASCFGAAPPFANNGGDSAATSYGNVPRNAFRGPFQQSVDFTISKSFKLADRHSLTFRTDFFNLFNHPVFNFPASNAFNNPSFGQITQTVIAARIIQFGLKYEH